MVAVATALFGASSAVAAPTLKLNKACYTSADSVHYSGSGWPPLDTLKLSFGSLHEQADVSQSGTFGGITGAPDVHHKGPFVRNLRFTATDITTPSISTSIAFREATQWASASPSKGSPGRTVRWRFSGFPAHKSVFGHFMNTAGTLLGTESFGRTHGACGVLTTRRRLAPHGVTAPGSYTVAFDTHRHQNLLRTVVDTLIHVL
ncbi:MAG TPA: hypothetical protein VJU80_06010 [Solirubrobacteraceae bacterium]|nr:hypothetical protein [Solirubrobacteraceae bacterium]